MSSHLCPVLVVTTTPPFPLHTSRLSSSRFLKCLWKQPRTNKRSAGTSLLALTREHVIVSTLPFSDAIPSNQPYWPPGVRTLSLFPVGTTCFLCLIHLYAMQLVAGMRGPCHLEEFMAVVQVAVLARETSEAAGQLAEASCQVHCQAPFLTGCFCGTYHSLVVPCQSFPCLVLLEGAKTVGGNMQDH